MMPEWEEYTMHIDVVGPRWRDRIKVAWQILRGYNKLQYQFNVQLKSGRAEAYVDAPVCRLVVSGKEPNARQSHRTEEAT